jgi:histone acetyltransferase (RNA polymerase elongator complex component)
MIVPLFLPHLGCGERCAYCNQDLITGSEKGGGSLEERIDALLAPLDAPAEVALYGGNVLGLDAPRLDGLFRLFEPYRDKISHLRISAKPGPLDATVLELLKRHGVRTVELGIPTFNDDILAALGRRHTADDLFLAYRILREEGFHTGLQVMVGLPGETPRDLRQTASAVAGLAPAFIRIYPLLVIEDTGLYCQLRKGRFSPDSMESAVAKTAFIFVSAWDHGIKTIKMGLTENEALRRKIAAGPFHPAFGALVKSEAFYLAALRKCRQAGITGSALMRVHPRDVPHLTGYKRANLSRLKAAGITAAWKEEGTMEKDRFVIEAGGKRVKGSLADALAMLPF